jgi:hypothetical protein
MEKRGPPSAARWCGAKTSGQLVLAQAYAMKVMTSRAIAASSLAADGGQARWRASYVRILPGVMVAFYFPCNFSGLLRFRIKA